jgi:hypothetical protein
MKKTKKNENKWYLFIDGTDAKITNTYEDVSALKGVILTITADEAASILALRLENKGDH